MPTSPGRQKVNSVLGEPRGRLLAELCGAPQTANDLAQRVGTSGNAVRVHLEGLEAAGLVSHDVVRRGVGKPTHVYSLTPSGETLISFAYPATLRALLRVLRQRMNGGFVDLLRQTGETMVDGASLPADSANRAAVILEELGATVTHSREGADLVVAANCCPLAGVVREIPEMCQMVEQALTSATGRQVSERCERGAHPRCTFVIGA